MEQNCGNYSWHNCQKVSVAGQLMGGVLIRRGVRERERERGVVEEEGKISRQRGAVSRLRPLIILRRTMFP